MLTNKNFTSPKKIQTMMKHWNSSWLLARFFSAMQCMNQLISSCTCIVCYDFFINSQ